MSIVIISKNIITYTLFCYNSETSFSREICVRNNFLPFQLSKKSEFILTILFFTAIIILFTFTNHTFLGIQDEVQLQATLSAGDPKNYDTSYPLALLAGMLYKNFPDISWYSVIMLSYIWIIAILMAIYIVVPDYKNRFFKYSLFILALFMTIYMLIATEGTFLTLMLVIAAIPLIRKHQAWFWFFLWLASFLREELIVSVAPLYILAYLLSVKKSSFSKKNIAIIVLFASGIAFNHLSPALDKEYSKWLEFTKARLYFTDLTGMDEKHILTKDEYELAKTWWICDTELYPVDKIPLAAGSTLDAVKDKIFYEKELPRRIFAIPYHHPIIILLALLTLYLIYDEKSNIRRGYFLLFGIGFVLLLLVKDVERVTFPLLLLWWMIVILEFIRNGRNKLLNISIPIVILFVLSQTPWFKLIDYQQNEALVKEFKAILKKNKMQLEISSGFTASWDYLTTVLKQNHLMDEKNWVDYNNDLLLSGWFTQHPLCLKQHNISFEGVKRKYDRYYDWLLAPDTGIIGAKGETKHIRPFLANNLLRMYDEKLAEPGCRHEVKTVDESEHFIIHQIIKVCQE